MSSMREICLKYPVKNDEFKALDKEFGRLCWKVAHELKRKNSKNNYTDEAEDIHQKLIIAMLCAGSYQKRQVYIEKSLLLLKNAIKDEFSMIVLAELELLWKNRTKHGANKQKFGHFQEDILQNLVEHFVSLNVQPSPSEDLIIDSKFANYCRSIIYNEQKNIGKKITREKTIRTGCISLSEYDFLQYKSI